MLKEGGGWYIARRLWRRRCSRRWLAPWAFAVCLAFAWSVHRLTLSWLVRLVQRLALTTESILLQRRRHRRRSSTTTYFFFAFPQSFGPLAWLDRQRLGTTVLTLHYIFVWSWLNLSVFQSGYIIFTTLGLKRKEENLIISSTKQQYNQPLQNNKIIFKCLCVKWDHHLQWWKPFWNRHFKGM